MATNRSFWDMEKNEQEQFFAEATKEAIEHTHEKGQSTCHKDDKGLYLLCPNGEKQYIPNNPPKKRAASRTVRRVQKHV